MPRKDGNLIVFYKWRMTFQTTGEVLISSRIYSDDAHASRYLPVYLYNHYAKIRGAEEPCTELVIWREDGTLLLGIYGDVFDYDEEDR